MKTVSIIIPNFNNKDFLKENIPILIRHTSSVSNWVEIIAVDDGSTDGSEEFLRENFPQVKVISLGKNYGYSNACNVGAKVAKGEIIYLLNSDVSVCEGFLEPLIPYFDENDVFAVSSMEIGLESQVCRVPENFGIPLVRFKWGIFWYWYETISNYEKKSIEVFTVSGGHTAYSRGKFLSLNGYDVVFRPLYAEDGDVCWRAWRKGWRSLYEPKSLVRHKLRGTVSRYYTQSQIQSIHWKNRFLLTWKDVISGWSFLEHILFLIPELFILPLLGKKEFTIGFFKALKQLPELVESRRRDRIDNPVYSNRQLFRFFSSPGRIDIDKINKDKDVNLRVKPDPHNTQFIEAMATYYFIKNLVENKRVLDAGCGFGYGTDYLSKWADEVVGIDLSQEAINWAKKNYHGKNVRFILSDLKGLEFSDGYFDVVCLFEVIHQDKEYQKLLNEVCRVLKEGGLFLISTRRKKSKNVKPQLDHVQEFNAEELKELLSKSGFDNIEMYGLGRPNDIGRLEEELKNIRRFDLLGLKKFIPRRIISFLIYTISKSKGIKPPQKLSYEDFRMSKDSIDTDPGILAICRKK